MTNLDRARRSTACADDTATPPRREGAPANVVELERYVPAFLTSIANKLSRGASQHYLNGFNVGIETWRCPVLLAVHTSISAQQASRSIGMDKASVSRRFKSMQAEAATARYVSKRFPEAARRRAGKRTAFDE